MKNYLKHILCLLGTFACFFVVCCCQLFLKIPSGIPSECQPDRIQIKPDVLLGLIWVQSVCNGYQQTTLVINELVLFCQFLNSSIPFFLSLCMLGNFSCFCCRLLTFFKINFFQKFFHEHYQSVIQFSSRSGPTLCWCRSGLKLFARVTESADDKSCHQQEKS